MPRTARPDAEIDQLVFPVARRLWAGGTGEDPQARSLGRILRDDQGEAIGQNHIQRSLDRWRQAEKRPAVPAPTEQLSPEVTRGLLDWLAREREAVRTDLDSQITVLKTTR